MLQILVGSAKWHRRAFIFHVLLTHQDLSGSLLEEVHLGTAEVELLVVLCLILLLLMLALLVERIFPKVFWFILLWLVILALILLLDCILLFRSYIFSDEEVLRVVSHHIHLLMLLIRAAIPELVLLLLRHESHLLVIWWSEDLFVLCFLREFGRENLTLNVAVRLDV